MRSSSRSLPLLLGLATVAVVTHHATGLMLPGGGEAAVRGGVEAGSASYTLWLLVNQLCLFALPAFFFVSGYFGSYAARGDPPTPGWRVIRNRLAGLLVPYLFWSLLVYVARLAEGEGEAPPAFAAQLARRLVLPRVFDLFFFVPVLCQFYLLAPAVTRLAKKRPGVLLGASALLQALTMALFYLRAYGVAVAGWVRLVVDNEVATFARWALYFPLGSVCFFHRRRVGQVLGRFGPALAAAAALFGVLSVVECEFALRIIGYARWAREQGKASSVLFALAFILFFAVSDRMRVPGARLLEEIGKRSLGVYFLHGHLVLWLASLLQGRAPRLAACRVLFQSLVIGAGLALPVLLMVLVARSPARRLYRRLFG